MSAPSAVPVIDIAPFSSSDPKARQKVVDAVRRACEEIGFLTIVGHGIPQELIESVRRQAFAFFSLPADEKNKIKRPSQEISRGYNRMGDQALAYTIGKATPPDLQESFAFGRSDVPAGDPYYTTDMGRIFFASNLWPEQPKELRDTIVAYQRAVTGLAGRIMNIFALALNLDETFFDDKIDRAISLLRIVHYPPQATAPVEGQLRCGEHTDYGTLTILYGDDVPGGLQVRDREGQWIDVHPVPGSYVINIGDLMMRWTNDRWISTMHRVANPPRQYCTTSRLSLVFFHQPNYDVAVEALPTCLAGKPPKYGTVTSGGHWLSKHMKARHMDVTYDALAKVAGD